MTVNFRALGLVAGLAGVLIGPNAASAASGRIVIEEGGVRRSALIEEFQRLKRGPRPTIVVLHGGSGSGSGVRRNLGLDALARASGTVVVYPDAVEGRWAGVTHGRAGLADDQVYVRRLVEKLVADRIADPRRVGIVGVSTGGLLAIRLACTSADLFSSASAIITNMPKSLEGNCKPAKPIPFLLINGTADTLIPYGGGRILLGGRTAEVLSTEATLAPFAQAAGCAPDLSNELFAKRDAADPTKAVLQKFARCAVPVELIKIEGGGHRVPGRTGGGGTSNVAGLAPPNETAGLRNNDVDASKAIFDFFRRVGN